jgi:hypothetical protein
MRLTIRALPAAALLAATLIRSAEAQAPPEFTPTPAAPPAAEAAAAPIATPVQTAPAAPPPASALRIVDPPAISTARLPEANPFGSTAEVPAALPAKLVFEDAAVSAGFFASIHIDAAGKVLTVRRDRDPIPSLAGETLKSLARWTFAPARRAGQPVDTWGAFRLDLYVEIDSPRIIQMAFTPVLPTAPIPAPFQWPSDTDWLDSRKPANPTDGSVPIVEVDTAPIPQKTPWSADSFKGPFVVRYWVKVNKTGKIDRAIPLEVSDPVLLSYFRKAMAAWVIRPAQNAGAPVDSWNELTLSGQVSYSVDVKQIAALRRPIGP